MFVPTPIGNQMIILIDAAPTKTEGGLHIPEVAQNKNTSQKATILALGTGEKVREQFNTRQRIAVKRMHGMEIDYMGIKAIQIDMAHVINRFDFVVPGEDVIEQFLTTDEGIAQLRETYEYSQNKDNSFDFTPEDAANILVIGDALKRLDDGDEPEPSTD